MKTQLHQTIKNAYEFYNNKPLSLFFGIRKSPEGKHAWADAWNRFDGNYEVDWNTTILLLRRSLAYNSFPLLYKTSTFQGRAYPDEPRVEPFRLIFARKYLVAWHQPKVGTRDMRESVYAGGENDKKWHYRNGASSLGLITGRSSWDAFGFESFWMKTGPECPFATPIHK